MVCMLSRKKKERDVLGKIINVEMQFHMERC